MLKSLIPVLISISSVYSQFVCPNAPIEPVTLGGNLPVGANDLVVIPANLNCTFDFDIPLGYALLIKFSVNFQSDNDTVSVIDNLNRVRNLPHNGRPTTDAPLWLSATRAKVIVTGVSGKSRFKMNYAYQPLNNYQRASSKKTGEYFPLSSITGNTYYTITSPIEKVIASYAQIVGADLDNTLNDYYVYDGDDINKAVMIGSLYDVGQGLTVSTGKSVSFVNFYGSKSASSYALGNDASTVQVFSKYTVLMTSLGSAISGNMTNLSLKPGGYTFICTDCTKFYFTQMQFDSLSTISNKGYITFQGQTPTHKREQLIKYDPMTLTSNYFPQLMPTNILTINLYLSRVSFRWNNVNDDTTWKTARDGRVGYLMSPNLWMSVASDFNQEFSSSNELFYSLSMTKVFLGTNNDQMTVKIGSNNNNPVVNNVYSPSKSANGVVSAKGSFMQVILKGSVVDDVRLRFEMANKPETTTRSGWRPISLAAIFSLVLVTFI